MDFASMSVKQVHILRIDPGEDVLESVKRFLKEADTRQAVVLGGYGTLAAYHLHWVEHNRIPTNNVFRHAEGGFEILTMNGLVVEGEPHIHITLSTPEGAFGGHLEPDCIAYVLCQVFFAEVEGVSLTRQRVPVSVEGMGEGNITQLVFTNKQGTTVA
jgi:predicted DNA-binding protein with PD1-like motif